MLSDRKWMMVMVAAIATATTSVHAAAGVGLRGSDIEQPTLQDTGATDATLVVKPTPLRIAINSAAQHYLNHAAGLINKNTVMDDNRVAISKSNIGFRQDDSIDFEALDQVPFTPQVQVQVPTLTRPKMDASIARQKQLNDATALINKNALMSDNNVVIAKSNLLFRQRDKLDMDMHRGIDQDADTSVHMKTDDAKMDQDQDQDQDIHVDIDMRAPKKLPQPLRKTGVDIDVDAGMHA